MIFTISTNFIGLIKSLSAVKVWLVSPKWTTNQYLSLWSHSIQRLKNELVMVPKWVCNAFSVLFSYWWCTHLRNQWPGGNMKLPMLVQRRAVWIACAVVVLYIIVVNFFGIQNIGTHNFIVQIRMILMISVAISIWRNISKVLLV